MSSHEAYGGSRSFTLYRLYSYSASFFFISLCLHKFICKEQNPSYFHLIILKHTPLCAALNLIILKYLLSKAGVPYRIIFLPSPPRREDRLLYIKKFEDPRNPAASEFTRRRPDYPFSVKWHLKKAWALTGGSLSSLLQCNTSHHRTLSSPPAPSAPLYCVMLLLLLLMTTLHLYKATHNPHTNIRVVYVWGGGLNPWSN